MRWKRNFALGMERWATSVSLPKGGEMEIEIRGRKMILPVETVFDLDRNAAVWKFVFPEQIAKRETATLEGWLAVKTNVSEQAVRIGAFREGTCFTVTLPTGLFQGASVAEVQFSLRSADFTWHTEIETVNVVRCLDPLGDTPAYTPNVLEELEDSIKENEGKIEEILSGARKVGSAQKDGEGNVIALTYATKAEVTALGEELQENYATKEALAEWKEESEGAYVKNAEMQAFKGEVLSTFATKEELSDAQETNAQTFASREDLASAQAENGKTFATKEAVEDMQENNLRSFVTKDEFSGAQAGIAQMYATKGDLAGAQETNAQTFATKGEVTKAQETNAQTFATKEELSDAQESNLQNFATKGELSGAQAGIAQTYATKGELYGEIATMNGGATELTDLKKVEEVLLNEEHGNAALYEKCAVLDENSSWYLLDYAVFCAESEISGTSAVTLFRNKLKEIKQKFQGVTRPNVMVYTTNNKNPFFGTSAFDFVSGINYYYYTYSTSEITASIKIKNCQNINLHGFVMTGKDYMDSALQLINCTNIRVERCALTNKGKGAVTLENARDIVIEDCALYGSGYQSTAEVTVKDTSTNETSITFRHCRFKDNGFGALNASGVTNANLSIVLDHVYFVGGRKVSTADCVSGNAKISITALEEDLPTLATAEKDGLISKEQSAFLSEFQQGQGRHRFAFGELGMYEEYPVNVQVEYVRTGLKCGFLNLVYRMPEIPETETRFGHVSIEKLNALMRSRFGFDFSISNRITGVWFASEKEHLLQAGCGVGVYSNYLEPVTITTEGKNVGLSLKQTGGALFRMLNVFVNER